MARKPFPILFITSTRIGDAVLSTGLLKRLHDEIPYARFTIAAGPAAAPLFRETPNLEELIPLEKQSGGMHWVGLWQRVRRTKWGLVVDVRGSGIAQMVSTKVKAVYKRPPEGAPILHKVEELAALLKVEEEPPAPHCS
jgi:ADP-heptose:LPS heptosyltransferase